MRLDSPQINLITKACMKASKALIRDFGEIENLQVSTKGPGDFVTSADKRTEKILIEELLKAKPEYGIISEEAGIINKSNTTIFELYCSVFHMLQNNLKAQSFDNSFPINFSFIFNEFRKNYITNINYF